MTDADTLRAGQAALIARGWGQGQYQDRDGHVCVYGSLIVGRYGSVTFGRDDQDRSELLVAAQLLTSVATGSEDGHLALWNDVPGRTMQEVLDLYAAALAIAEQQEASALRETVTVA